MGYKLEGYTSYIGWEKTLESARWRAFEIVMKNKKADVFIKNESTRKLSGMVYYSKHKDKYGKVIGPVYFSFKNNKTYLLDYDGKIFDQHTGRKVRGQYQRKTKR